MEFDDIYELLEAVRTYKLRPKECLMPINSMTGTIIGYATADSDFPSIEWTIPLGLAKETALARGTKESRYIRELLGSYMGRKQLLDELRRGTLEYGIARPPEGSEAPQLGVDLDQRSAPVPTILPQAGPRQCYIPGL